MSPREHRASLRRDTQEGSYCAQFKTYHDEMKENEEPPPNHNRLPRPLGSGAGRDEKRAHLARSGVGAFSWRADSRDHLNTRMNPNSCPTCEGTRLVTNHPGIDEPCPDCRAPEGSCLICGELAPFAVWSGSVGCCQKCRDAKQERDDAVRDLGNAQQWIDSDPEWKAQYMAIAQDQSARIAELERRVEELERENERLRTVLCESRKESSRAWGINTSQVAQIGMMSNIRAELESEISQLRAEVERLKGRNYNLEIANSSLQRERDEARAALKLKAATLAGIANDLVNARTQLAEREEDRALLERLSETAKSARDATVVIFAPLGPSDFWRIEYGNMSFADGDTLRAAIRAARAQEDGK